VTTPLEGSQTFKVVKGDGIFEVTRDWLDNRKELERFQLKVLKLERAVQAAVSSAGETATKLEQIRRALDQAPGIDSKWKDTARTLEKRNREILRALRGDVVLQRRNENTPLAIQDWVRYITSSQRFSLGHPTRTQQESYQIASTELSEVIARLKKVTEVDLKDLEKALDEAGAPPTPGRLPAWKEK
jgi:hypothetical protein